MATTIQTRPRSQERVRDILIRARATTYPLLAIVGLIIWFSTQSDRFMTVDNWWTIGRGAAVLMLVALAGTLVILIGSIDLSVAGNVTVSGIVCAELIDGSGLLVAIVAALAVGAAIGLINAGILLTLKIPSFLVTLGMLSVLTGIANTITKGAPVTFLDQALPNFMNGEVIGIPTVIVLTVAIVILLTIVASRTKLGRYLYAIGGGEPVAAVSGVPVARYKIFAFVLGGVLCGIAGVFITGQVGAGTADVGSDLLLDSIAAVVMGGTALSGGVGGPQRTVLGVLVIAILSNGMDIIGIGQDPQSIVKGLVIIAAVALSMDRSRATVIK
ncbi:ABC transporter permease [Capillimicrobium parvum]|uniref:D-allose transport system permease protein AlsC n=1 Tax=Capillimicrobium parvum TaxID=2884022 RepID=A0A9E7BXK2_9ACTN|nr:ABC transporter permease [Capillimicrobium parvum]UGS34066.1 D-allose transport system permease protein AlsC [Capillimicrobium parvum]